MASEYGACSVCCIDGVAVRGAIGHPHIVDPRIDLRGSHEFEIMCTERQEELVQ